MAPAIITPAALGELPAALGEDGRNDVGGLIVAADLCGVGFSFFWCRHLENIAEVEKVFSKNSFFGGVGVAACRISPRGGVWSSNGEGNRSLVEVWTVF